MEKCPISRDLISVAGEPIVWLIKEILVLKTPFGGKNSFSLQPTLTYLTKTVKTWVRRNEKNHFIFLGVKKVINPVRCQDQSTCNSSALTDTSRLPESQKERHDPV